MRATAAEQGVPDAVTATEARLGETLGLVEKTAEQLSSPSKQPGGGKALVVVAPKGEIAGMAIYFVTYVAWAATSGMCLEDLFVLPQYRCRGYARLLVQAVAKEAGSSDCARTEWLCYKENRRALRFYRSLGAKELDNLTLLRLDRDAMEELSR
jgi:GNAT superfamily N-acetyltransferase